MLYTKDNTVKEQRDITIEVTSRTNAFGAETDFTYTVSNPTHAQLTAAGWTPYLSEKENAVERYISAALARSASLTDAEALGYQPLLPQWDTYIGGSLRQGQCVSYGGRPWRVRQDIPAVLENQAPGVETAALYERIDEEHEGTAQDPIPYEPPMEILSGKYYTEGGILYLCTRDSGTALTHTLAQLVGLYVETAPENPAEQ